MKYLAKKAQGANQSEAAIAAGDDPTHSTRLERAIARDPEYHPIIEKVRDEQLAAFKSEGVNARLFAKGVKQGMKEGNPASLRLYAEVVRLVGTEKADQIVVIAFQHVQQVLIPVLNNILTDEQKDQFADRIANLQGHQGA